MGVPTISTYKNTLYITSYSENCDVQNKNIDSILFLHAVFNSFFLLSVRDRFLVSVYTQNDTAFSYELLFCGLFSYSTNN
jgi:hypothetical protein